MRTERGNAVASSEAGAIWFQLLQAIGVPCSSSDDSDWLSPWRLLLQMQYERFIAHWYRQTEEPTRAEVEESLGRLCVGDSLGLDISAENGDAERIPLEFLDSGHDTLSLHQIPVALVHMEKFCFALESALEGVNREPARTDVQPASQGGDSVHTGAESVVTGLYASCPDVSSIIGVLYAWIRVGMQLEEQCGAALVRRKRAVQFSQEGAPEKRAASEQNFRNGDKQERDERFRNQTTCRVTSDRASSSDDSAEDSQGKDHEQASTGLSDVLFTQTRLRAAVLSMLASQAYWRVLSVMPEAFVPFVFKAAVHALRQMTRAQGIGALVEEVSTKTLSALAALFDSIPWIRYLLRIGIQQVSVTGPLQPQGHRGSPLADDDSNSAGLEESLSGASELILRRLVAVGLNKPRSTKLLCSKEQVFRSAWKNMIMVTAFSSEQLVRGALRPVLNLFIEGLSLKGAAPVIDPSPTATPAASSNALHSLSTALCELLQAAGREAPEEAGTSITERISAAVLVLLQHLSIRAPETAVRRSTLAQCILSFLITMESTDIYRFCSFVQKLTQHPRAAVRCLALEIAANIEEEPDDDPAKSSEDAAVAWALFYRSIWARIRDRHALVRARALTATAAALDHLAGANQSKARALLLRERQLLISRLRDEKAPVRKSALTLAFITLEMLAQRSEWTRAADRILAAVQERCADTHLAVRLAAAQQVTRLASSAPSAFRERFINAWCDSVLQLVYDPEPAVVEACLEGFLELLFSAQNSVADAPAETQSQVCPLVGNTVLTIAAGKGDPRRPFLFLLWHRLSQRAPLPDTLYQWLCESAHPQGQPGAWHLLAQLTSYAETARQAVVRHILESNQRILIDLDPDDPVANEVTQVVAQTAPAAGRLVPLIQSDARTLLFQLRGNPGRIPALIQCLARVATNPHWSQELIQACSELLSLEPAEYACSSLEERACALTAWSELVLSGLAAPDDERLRVRAEAILADSERSSENLRAYALLALGKLCIRGDDTLARHGTSVLLRELETSASSVLRNNAVLILADMCRVFSWLADQYAVRIAAAMRDPSPFVRRQTTMVLTGLLEEEFVKPKKDGLVFLFLSVTQDDDPIVSKLARQCLERVFFPRNPAERVHQLLESLFYFNDCTCHPRYNQHAGMHQSRAERARFTFPQQEASRHRIYQYLISNCTDEQVLLIADRLAAELIGGLLDGEMGPFPAILDEDSSVYNVVSDTLKLLASRNLAGERWHLGTLGSSMHSLEWITEAETETETTAMWLLPAATKQTVRTTGALATAPVAIQSTTGAQAGLEAPRSAQGLASAQARPTTRDALPRAGNASEETALQVFRGHLLPVLARQSLEQTILPALVELRRHFEQLKHPLVGVVIEAIREQLRPHRADLWVLLRDDPVFAREIAHDLHQETAALERQRASSSARVTLSTQVAKAGHTPRGTPGLRPYPDSNSAARPRRRGSFGPPPLQETNQDRSPRTPAAQLMTVKLVHEDILTSRLRRPRQSGSGTKTPATHSVRKCVSFTPSLVESRTEAETEVSPPRNSRGTPYPLHRVTPRSAGDPASGTPLSTTLLDAVDGLSISFEVPNQSSVPYERLIRQRRCRRHLDGRYPSPF
jgi:hypothetical protein